MFNFNLSEVQPSNTTNFLKPYDIYQNVYIDSIEMKEGTNKDGKPWKSMVITFKNDDGIYNDSIFWITDDDSVIRKEYIPKNGGKRYMPSQWEQTRDKMGAIGFAFFPEMFTKLQEVSKTKSFKTAKEAFDFLGKAFFECVKKSLKKVKTNMKLIGRTSNGKVYATLPNCTGIACADTEKKASEHHINLNEWWTWMISPFGDNLTFSDYEISKANEYRNAKPTQMDSPETTVNSESDVNNTNEDDELTKLMNSL